MYVCMRCRVSGTTAQSCSIRLVLGNLCWHLASLAGVDVLHIPGDYPGLVSYFHRMLKVCSYESQLQGSPRQFTACIVVQDVEMLYKPVAKVIGKNDKGFPYLLPSVGLGVDPSVQAVSPQVT